MHSFENESRSDSPLPSAYTSSSTTTPGIADESARSVFIDVSPRCSPMSCARHSHVTRPRLPWKTLRQTRATAPHSSVFPVPGFPVSTTFVKSDGSDKRRHESRTISSTTRLTFSTPTNAASASRASATSSALADLGGSSFPALSAAHSSSRLSTLRTGDATRSGLARLRLRCSRFCIRSSREKVLFSFQKKENFFLQPSLREYPVRCGKCALKKSGS